MPRGSAYGRQRRRSLTRWRHPPDAVSESDDESDPVVGPQSAEPSTGAVAAEPVAAAEHLEGELLKGERTPEESSEHELPQGAAPGPAVNAAEAIALADPQLVRRAPRYGRFAMTGVVLGIVVCAIAVLLFAEPNEYRSLPGVFLLVAVFVVPVCALLACLLALLLERRKSASSRKRAPGA